MQFLQKILLFCQVLNKNLKLLLLKKLGVLFLINFGNGGMQIPKDCDNLSSSLLAFLKADLFRKQTNFV